MNPLFEEVPGDRSVNRARVHVDKAEAAGERSRDTTFARGSWAINRDYSMKISLKRVHEMVGPSLAAHCAAMQRASMRGCYHVRLPLAEWE
jgi:hypothetical protein